MYTKTYFLIAVVLAVVATLAACGAASAQNPDCGFDDQIFCTVAFQTPSDVDEVRQCSAVGPNAPGEYKKNGVAGVNTPEGMVEAPPDLDISSSPPIVDYDTTFIPNGIIGSSTGDFSVTYSKTCQQGGPQPQLITVYFHYIITDTSNF